MTEIEYTGQNNILFVVISLFGEVNDQMNYSSSV